MRMRNATKGLTEIWKFDGLLVAQNTTTEETETTFDVARCSTTS